VHFSVCADNESACLLLAEKASERGLRPGMFIDIDNGMHRTGISPEQAPGLAEMIEGEEALEFRGLHIYDGHIHEKDPEVRKRHCEADFEKVNLLVDTLKQKGIGPGELACGGTFTFPIHAAYPERTLCPGTPLLWDAGYEAQIPDVEFLHAAVLAGRVISKPQGNLCIDFGYKAVASEMTQPRVQFLNLSVNEILNHSEEHLVVSAEESGSMKVGDVVYALPWHICPTMALHEKVYVINQNRVTDTWQSAARNRIY